MKKFITESELKDRISSLKEYMDSISEQPAAPAAAPDARAQYDQFKADDAKKAAIDKVKQYASIPLNQIPRLANAIDPKTGIIYYGDDTGYGAIQPKKMPVQFMQQADQKPMLDALTAAGLKVVPSPKGQGMFGDRGGYAMVDPQQLANLGKEEAKPAAAAPAPAEAPAAAAPAPAEAPVAVASPVTPPSEIVANPLPATDANGEQATKVAEKPPATAPEAPAEYVVKPGDNLTKIAKANGIANWQDIYNLNKDIIKNPNLIYPNQKLKMPAKPAAAPAPVQENVGYDEIQRLVNLVHYR